MSVLPLNPWRMYEESCGGSVMSRTNDNSEYRKIQKACMEVGRSEQVIECQYWDLEQKCLVTRLAGPEDKTYKTIPTGGGYEM